MNDDLERRIWAVIDSGFGVIGPAALTGAVVLIVWALSGWLLR